MSPEHTAQAKALASSILYDLEVEVTFPEDMKDEDECDEFMAEIFGWFGAAADWISDCDTRETEDG